MRKFVLSCLFMIVSLSLRAADYYWVGGAGAWDDLNHWATTSGGTSKRSVVPSSGDDVFFDVNSGLANGNIVTLPASGAAYCHNISWLGVTTTASFRNNGSSRLYVYGNVELAALVTYGITIEFAGGGVATYKINGANKVAAGWYNSFAVNKPNGTVKLLDNIPLNFGVDNITLTSGMVDLSGGNHVFTHLYGNTGGLVRGVNITGATITMAGAWDLQGPNVTVIGDNSYISAQLFHSASGYYPKVDVTAANSGAMKIYNTGFGALTFTSAAAQSGASVVLQGNTIRRLEFKGAGTLGNANNTIDTLIMAPGKVLQVYGAQTINKFLQMKTPDCSGLNQIQGKDIFAKLNFSTGAAVDLYNVYVGSMIATGSITPLTFQGIDGGGNTGFNIQPPGSGITLYWVGGAGDWNDINHWSTTSGGPGGACLPLTADDVVFDSNSGFAPGSIVTTTTNAWCHNMTWRNITAPVTFNKSISYSMEVWGSLVMHPSVTMNADLLMKGQEASTLTTNGSTLGLLKLNILKTGPNGGVTLIDNFTNIQATVKAITGKLIMANQTLDINEFASIGTAIRAVDITNTTITTHYIWITTDTACTWVNNGAGSFITSQGYLIAAGLTYPKVYCTSDKDYFRISRANIGELQFTNTSPSSLAGIDKNNNIGTLEFKGAGNIRNAGNSIMRLLLAPSRRYNFSGSNTIQEHLRLNSPDCGVMGEIRSKDANPAILQFSPGVTFNLANVYIQNMTATGSGVPLSVTGVDAGGNSGFNITTTGGNSRYWVGGSGEWNDPSHWSATSGGAGGACVPTIKDDVYFDANSFTSGSSNVKIASGQAYCRNMDWTGASFNPVFDHDATLTLEVWGNLQMNPSVTMNTVLTFEGASNNTITTNGSNTGKFSIYVVKPGISNVLRIMDDFSNPNTRITLKSGGLDLSGINVQVNIITDDTTALATSMNITNARIATNWTYFGANKNLQASGSTLTVPYFIVNGGAYNRVDVTTYVGGQMNISKTTIEDLVFSNTNATTGAFIGGNNQINRLEFKSRGTIGGPSNTIGTLIFTPGKVYTFAAGSNTTITNDWFGSGTPCNLTEFISASSTVNATITKTGSNISFDYVRVKGITAAGTTPFAAGEHSTDQGGNVKWDFKPYNGSAPISGLGPDITLCTEQFPYILKTDGFFASPTSQYKWNDGSANSTLTATKGGTYSVQVSFSDGCTVSGQIVITEIKLAVAPITGTTNICVGSTTTLGNTTAGGTWSSSDATIATIDANGIVTGVSTGTATITYEVTNANGCKAQQTATVTVNALPVVSPITGTTSICMGVATTLSNTTPGGVWSSGNTAVATVDANSGLVTGVTAGTATITYEVTNANGCKAQQTAPVTVNALPVVSPITGTTNICTGTATTLSNTTSGGVWSSSNTAVATVDANSGLVTGVTAGTATITYEVTNANGCKAQQTAPVTVNALPVVS
ncbi:MAG: Ig-like domain-containing protein, partial [Chitinophaga sp.]|uniref:Ig-like domain-containing protein n=1 Tax=Chitinophaga sp. TaxID=1869181 RepID=UPI0025C2A87F